MLDVARSRERQRQCRQGDADSQELSPRKLTLTGLGVALLRGRGHPITIH
jgi:hypothetical protein